MRFRSMLDLWMVFLLAAACAACAGCGGAGGGSGSGAGGIGGNPVGTGSVAVLITDAPTDEYESIFVTIREISLIPAQDGAHVLLFSSGEGEEFDLLDLRDEEMLLTIGHEIPAGTYEKIRMEISDVRTVGGPCDTLEVKLPSGKIDMIPDDAIEVAPDTVLVLHLDIDANKSIHLHQAGNSGKCIFSPVVRITAEQGSAHTDCPQDLVGTILSLSSNEGGETVGFVLDLGETRGSVDVVLSDGTGIFDADGLPAEASVLEVGQIVTVRGPLGDDAAIDAQTVAVGETLALAGTVDSVAEDATLFNLDLDADGAVVGSVDVSVTDGTLILADCKPVAASAIQPGVHLTVHGKLALDDTVLRAVVIEVEKREIRGSLTEATDVDGGVELTVIPDGGTESETVLIPDGVGIFLEGDGEIPFDVLGVVLDCAPRAVTIGFDVENPVAPNSVVVDSEVFEGVLESVDAGAHLLDFGEHTVSVLSGAPILDLRGGEQQLIAIADLEPGSTLRIFGLAACESAGFDFIGFVVLVNDAVDAGGGDDGDHHDGDDDDDDDDDDGDDD